MKRFYRSVTVERGGGGHAVLLDGKPLMTPGSARVALPTGALARAVAGEWETQGEDIDPAAMPLMRLVATALDRVTAQRATVEADLAAFGAADLVCYRAETPAELVERQRALWQPLVDWAATAHDSALTVTTGVVPVEQPRQAVAALARPLGGLSDLELMAVHAVTTATGSLVIGLAFAAGMVDGTRAFEAGLLDELYGIEVWGDDPEAARRLEALRSDILAAERLLLLLREDLASQAGTV